MRCRKNPLGVFVNAINWSKELASAAPFSAFRKAGFAALLVSGFAVSGCATAHKPPAISYDDAQATPAKASQEPPKPVEVVAVPTTFARCLGS